jgi:hypothetical protein
VNGFLAGLVQRGASVPIGAAESSGLAAPAAYGDSAYALEAPPELVEVGHVPPTATPREDSVRTEQMAAIPRDVVTANPQHSVVHITQVKAVSAPLPRGQPDSAETPAPLRLPSVQRAESVRAAQPADLTPQPSHQTEPLAEPLRETVPVAAARPIAASSAADMVRATTQPRAELEVTDVSVPRRAPLDVTLSDASAPELPEVTLTAAPVGARELWRVAAATPSPTPPAAPPIHVRIGRVEVRSAGSATAPAAPRNASAVPALGFAAYRRLRTYRM